jgi:hypothetical protein
MAKDVKIEYDWDSGHCYSSLSLPRLPMIDEDEWTEAVNEVLYEELEEQMFCAPYIAGISENFTCCDTCPEAQQPDADYVEGFCKFVREHSPDSIEWYQIEKLEQWVKTQRSQS